jgi:site-specific DNA recombinase
LSLGEVVRRLAEREIPTPTGKAWWDRATIHGMLVNPAYHGTARYGKTRLVPRKTGRRPKRGDPKIPRHQKVAEPTSAQEQDPIRVPALVSCELFDAVAERLAENRRRHRSQKQGAEFLLGGLLICHACGSAYCGRRLPRVGSAVRYVYYRCIGTDKYRHHGEAICNNKGVNGSRLETAVWSDVCSLVKDPGRLRREFERRLERPSPETVDCAHWEDSIARLKRRMARLIDAYENGWLDKADFEPRIERVKQQLNREQETLARQRRESTSDEELRLLISQFDAFAQQINEGLQDADFQTRRKLLRLLIQRIEIDHAEVRIVYKVQPRPFVPSPAKRGELLQHCLQFHVALQGNPLSCNSIPTTGTSVTAIPQQSLFMPHFLLRHRDALLD